MNKYLITILVFLGCISCTHVKIINQPDYELNGDNIDLAVDRIELTDSVALFDISLYGIPGSNLKLSPETYLKGKTTSKEYKIKGTDNLTLGEWITIPETGYISSKIYFEPIAKEDTSIDFIEPGGWKIYGIKLYNDTKGKIKTTIVGTDDLIGNGSMLILEAGADPRVNKSYVVPVRDGKFSYDIYTDQPLLLSIFRSIEFRNGAMSEGRLWSEGGNVTITYSPDLSKAPEVTGGKLTSEMYAFSQKMAELHDKLFYDNEIGHKYKEMEESGDLYTAEANELIKQLDAAAFDQQKNEIREQMGILWENDKFYSPEGKIVNEDFNNYLPLAIDSLNNEYLKLLEREYKTPSLVGLGEIYTKVVYKSKQSDELLWFFDENYSDFMPEHPYSIHLSTLSKEANPIPGNHYIDFSAPTINGEKITISDVIKDKVAVIDLWASWCGPCRRHSMALIPIYEKYKDNGFEIIGIARENGDTDAMEKAIEKDGYPWINLVDLNDKLGVWSKYRAGLSGGKQILVDENGIIIAVDPTAEEVESYLKSHLK